MLNGGIDDIPDYLIKYFEDNMNPDYEYVIEKNVPLKDQKMSDITKVILSIIFRDYWATEEQRQIILEKEKADRIIDNKEKEEKYGTEISFNKKKTETTSIESENKLIVYKKENKIVAFFKRLFSRLKK